MLEKVSKTFVDVDGNFVEQFQTKGFDSRLWELYLHAYFESIKLVRDTSESKPDFNLSKATKSLCVEAVTVHPTQTKGELPASMTPKPFPTEDEIRANADLFAIKFGSPLFTKLGFEYWKMPHVTNRPLIFAIADFQETGSMVYTGTALQKYVYGFDHSWEKDEDDKLIVTPLAIDRHKHGKKNIPSNFFSQPDSENVSAILFSTGGTIAKFGRIGFQNGYRTPSLHVIRNCIMYNHQPDATEPNCFRYELGKTNYRETWGEGLSMFHNPNAKVPVDESLFPDIAHHHLVDGIVTSTTPEFHSFSSHTEFKLVY
jgi:hypothetical protein